MMSFSQRFVCSLLLLANLGSTAVAQDAFRRIAKFDHPGEGAQRFSGGRELAFSKDGKRLIVAFYTSRAQLFDLEVRKPVSPPFRTSGDGQVGFVSNETAYTADWASVKLWNSKTGQQIGQTIPHQLREDSIIRPAISPDGKRLATRTTMKSFQVWDAATQQPISQEHELESDIGSLRFSADNELLFARAGGQLFVHHSKTGKRVAGPFPTGWQFYHFPKQELLITTVRVGEGLNELVIRSTAKAEWSEVHRSKIAGRLKKIVPLDDRQLLIQAINSDYTPELFTVSIESPEERTQVKSNADRAFNLIVTNDKRRWISSNTKNISCQEFGESAPVWEINMPASGYDYRLFPFDREYFMIHEKQGALKSHRISDGSQVWTLPGVIRFHVSGKNIAIGNRDGVEIWAVD